MNKTISLSGRNLEAVGKTNLMKQHSRLFVLGEKKKRNRENSPDEEGVRVTVSPSADRTFLRHYFRRCFVTKGFWSNQFEKTWFK